MTVSLCLGAKSKNTTAFLQNMMNELGDLMKKCSFINVLLQFILNPFKLDATLTCKYL